MGKNLYRRKFFSEEFLLPPRKAHSQKDDFIFHLFKRKNSSRENLFFLTQNFRRHGLDGESPSVIVSNCGKNGVLINMFSGLNTKKDFLLIMDFN